MTKWFVVVPLVMILFVTACSSKEETSFEQEDTPAMETETAIAETEAALFLDITGPADKATVTEESVTVTGKTLPVAIVSVNGKIVKVQPDGTFSSVVSLEIGPNVIQVVASDISGAQTGKVIAVGRVE